MQRKIDLQTEYRSKVCCLVGLSVGEYTLSSKSIESDVVNKGTETVSSRAQRAGQGEDTTENSFTIGQLAREFQVTLRTLRFYEDRGLVSPRRDGTTRIYSRRDRARLKLVLMGKKVGFSLTEIELCPKVGDGVIRRRFEVA